MANSVVLKSYHKACACILPIVETYCTLWELAVCSNFNNFTTHFCEGTFQTFLRFLTYFNAGFSPFCLGFCSLSYNYPSQTLLERFRTMFSGYFTNCPIFHYVIKSPGASTEGYHSPHLPHSLKV